MSDFDIEPKVRDLLQRCTYSNDNLPQVKDRRCNRKSDISDACDINIIGDHNVVIEANILFMTVVFVISCIWLSLLR